MPDYNNSNRNGGTGASVAVPGLTCAGADRLAVAVAGSFGDAYPTGITYGGAAMSFLAQVVRVDTAYLSVYYLINPPTAASDVVATWAASNPTGAALIGLVYTGVDQVTPFGTPATANAESTSVTGAGGVTAAVGDLTFDAVSWASSGGATITPTGTGHAQHDTVNPFGGWTLTAGGMTGSGIITPTWTISSSQTWAQVVAVIKAAAGGGGVSPSPVVIGKQLRGLIYS